MEVQPQENSIQEEQLQSDALLRNQPSYKQKEYWNERYKIKETYYDWYCGYQELKPVFECYNLQKDAKILMVGCGNSKLSEDMYDDGYQNLVSTDISDIVIEQLKRDTQEKNKNMIFEVQDCTNLTYEDETFDLVFDKGTLDAISCDLEGESVNKMVKEMNRVCKKTGSIVIVSFGQLHERKAIFEESLGFENYSYQLCKKYLSVDSQLTNIMRHISNGLPMHLVLKNKNLLLQTIIELRKIKSSLNNEVIKSVEIDWENLSTIDELQQNGQNEVKEVQKEEEKSNNTDDVATQNIGKPSQEQKDNINTNQQENENENNNEKGSLVSESKSEEISDQAQKVVQQTNNVSNQEEQKEQEEQESSDEGDENEDEEEDQSNEEKSKFRRQTQCFIYRITLKN